MTRRTGIGGGSRHARGRKPEKKETVGTFKLRVEIARTPEGPFRGMYALVDTGSFYTWVPERILRDLGLTPMDSAEFETATGERITRDRFEAVIRIGGKTIHTICAAGQPGQTLLGAYTLEGLAVGVDPVRRRLVPLSPLPAMQANER